MALATGYKRLRLNHRTQQISTLTDPIMKTVLLVCLAAVALARPQVEEVVEWVRDERVQQEDGSFDVQFELTNGHAETAIGRVGEKGQVNMEGSYQFVDPNGNLIEVRYIANEFGFQPQGDFLPVAPPAPAHVAELLRIAEEQRAAGITFEKK